MHRKREKPDRSFQTQQGQFGMCVYCHTVDLKPSDGNVVQTPSQRRECLVAKRLCFNCTGPHKSAECKSVATCINCDKRHHTSICEMVNGQSEGVVTAHGPENNEVVYPIILVEIDGIKTHALLDTGAGISCVSSKLIDLPKKRPTEERKDMT